MFIFLKNLSICFLSISFCSFVVVILSVSLMYSHGFHDRVHRIFPQMSFTSTDYCCKQQSPILNCLEMSPHYVTNLTSTAWEHYKSSFLALQEDTSAFESWHGFLMFKLGKLFTASDRSYNDLMLQTFSYLSSPQRNRPQKVLEGPDITSSYLFLPCPVKLQVLKAWDLGPARPAERCVQSTLHKSRAVWHLPTALAAAEMLSFWVSTTTFLTLTHTGLSKSIM